MPDAKKAANHSTAKGEVMDQAAGVEMGDPPPAMATLEGPPGEAERGASLLWEAELSETEDRSPALSFTFIDSFVEEVLGYPHEQWLAEPDFWIRRIWAEDQERVRRFLHGIGPGRRTYGRFDCRTLAADGRIVWLRVRASLLQDRVSGATRLAGTMADISESAQGDGAEPWPRELWCLPTHELEARTRITSAILREQNPDEALEVILDETLLLLGVEMGGIYLNGGLGMGLKICHGVPGRLRNAIKFFPHERHPDWMSGTSAGPSATSPGEDPIPEGAREEGIRSWIWIPLKEQVPRQETTASPDLPGADPSLMGGLFLGSTRERAFRPGQRRALLAVSEQLEVAVSQARLAVQLSDEARVNHVLLLFISALNNARSPQAVCDLAVPFVARLIEGVQVLVWRWDARVSEPVPAAAPPELRSKFLDPEIPPSELSPLKEVCQDHCLVRVEDLGDLETASREMWRGFGAGSLLSLPLVRGRELLGAMCLARRETGPMAERQVSLARGVAEELANALQGEEAREQVLEHRQYLAHANEELRKSQEAMMMQERLRALGEMASGIAHDIGNALSPIVSYADLLLSGKEVLSERARRFIETIRTAGGDIDRTVARLREFYRPRCTQEQLLPVELNELVAQVIDLTRPRWKDIPQGKGLTMSIEADLQEGPTTVTGIQNEIREALTNLVLNSVDAMPEGGCITLRTRTARDHVTVEVQDEGVGMDEEVSRRCQEPFYSTKGSQGTGLGLSVVFGIMQRHEGHLRVDSQPGQGTTISLTFPRTEPGPLSEADRSGPAPSETGPLRILCIDDELLLRGLLAEMLESDGHQTVTVDSGEAGLREFREAERLGRPFAIVVTDLGMPHVDGREIAQAIKRESPRTIVILLTAWAEELKAQQGLPDGVDAVLAKPPRLDALRDTIARLVRG